MLGVNIKGAFVLAVRFSLMVQGELLGSKDQAFKKTSDYFLR
jgi:hypothetical protein